MAKKTRRTKPVFGREMEPCEYKERWANKLPKDQVIAIPAEDTKNRDVARDEGR